MYRPKELPFNPSNSSREELRVLSNNGRYQLGNVGFNGSGEVTRIDPSDAGVRAAGASLPDLYEAASQQIDEAFRKPVIDIEEV